ncbi:MAG: glycine cleavage T C-terminal barrel domain-containing protein [Gemmatimonadota bacterium]|nr:glycine cleavage T C-terminal barrel domain-containing protein [Gemmatimonadota bacterium]
MKSVIVDGQPIAFEEGDRALVAMLRRQLHPTGGGCLCLGGDCPHCLATVDGVSYVRTCQVSAYPGMVIEREHLDGRLPPLLRDGNDDVSQHDEVAVCNLHCDIVVIGAGASGSAAAIEARRAGKHVLALDAHEGQEAIGIYTGPLVVARTRTGMMHIHPREEIIVATGSAEIQPIAPGSHLAGIVTARAAEKLTASGVDLGKVVAIGSLPHGVEAEQADGDLVRFEGGDAVQAVVVKGEDGEEHRFECDTVSVGLGKAPRDALMRMGHELPVRVVGSAADPGDLPTCPEQGVICPCANVQVDDLTSVWNRGFHELELVKRATLAGTGTCQGATCLPYIRSFLKQCGNQLQPPFTARPVTRQLTFAEAAAGSFHKATPRTALDAEHRKLGAHMERSGGWWRPWHYGKPLEEYWAVREAVSIGDVSTLGKMQVAGPDALTFLEALYPTRVSSLKQGRCRYVLLLDERGYVFDDGLICRDGETRYTLTFTSAGSTMAELWIRDWAESLESDVRLLNQTTSLGAINVTGPLAAELLARAGVDDPPPFMRHGDYHVAGVACRVIRLSFTGELSFELHHQARDAVILWRRLLELGDDLGIKPHGLETLLRLRLEKGHIVVGQDTDYDATPRRIDHQWAVDLDHGNFVGKQAILRTDKIELDRQLVGLEMKSPAPIEGAVIWNGSDYAGYVTSSTDSPCLDRAVMLGWLKRSKGALPAEVTIDGRRARRVPTPFYDPASSRARVKTKRSKNKHASGCFDQSSVDERTSRFQRIEATRIVATAAALDALQMNIEQTTDCLAFRFAPDELWTTACLEARSVTDPHALIVPESGFAGAWLDAQASQRFLQHACEWPLPDTRPAFAQGAVAGVPVKLWLQEDRVLFLVPAPLAHTLERRMP